MYSVKKKSTGSSAGSSNEVCVIKPKQFDESTEIVDALLDNCTVILNLEGLDITLAQHIIDFTAGASYAIEGNIKKVTVEQFDSQINVNLRGSYFLAQQFLIHTNPKIKRNILFITSERGEYVDDLPYGLTKVALNSLTKGIAYRFAKYGVRVNAVAPGVTASEMTGFSEDDLYCSYNITKRVYLPAEIAEVAAFILSESSNCISGQIITCNEGKSINSHLR